MAGGTPYDNAEFSATEYVALYPDLQMWWTEHASVEEPQWHGDRNAWALNHWQTFGKAEGRQGRSTVFNPDVQQPSTNGLEDAPPAKSSNGIWLALAAAAVVGYVIWDNNRRTAKP